MRAVCIFLCVGIYKGALVSAGASVPDSQLVSVGRMPLRSLSVCEGSVGYHCYLHGWRERIFSQCDLSPDLKELTPRHMQSFLTSVIFILNENEQFLHEN